MNRTAGIALIVIIALGVAGVVAWQMRPGSVQTTPAPESPKPEPQPQVQNNVTPPKPVEPPKQAAEEAPKETPKEETAQAAPPAEDPFGGKPITVETLTGCKEVQKMGNATLNFEYAPNGEWKVNGNVRAKWTIEGNKVKIYKDGTDEVHYIDIVGNKLVYNGKEVNMTR